MIEPLACVIQYLLTRPEITGLVGDRIGPQHRYSIAWETTQPALVLQWNGGDPDLYLPIQNLRVEARAYAPTHAEAGSLWGALAALARATGRVPVAVGAETGLLYSLRPSGGPLALWDAEIQLPCLYGFFDAVVGETPLP
jgi:hypothetical protein